MARSANEETRIYGAVIKDPSSCCGCVHCRNFRRGGDEQRSVFRSSGARTVAVVVQPEGRTARVRSAAARHRCCGSGRSGRNRGSARRRRRSGPDPADPGPCGFPTGGGSRPDGCDREARFLRVRRACQSEACRIEVDAGAVHLVHERPGPGRRVIRRRSPERLTDHGVGDPGECPGRSRPTCLIPFVGYRTVGGTVGGNGGWPGVPTLADECSSRPGAPRRENRGRNRRRPIPRFRPRR
jgi:hypothetical protein